ncbi:MAG TPA: TIGR03435 family protein, partial [Candidatus Sulfopaludibacter sp.]|nr:TIGR03435 family protein [Candidatus Sulfopaludibacter sp.]
MRTLLVAATVAVCAALAQSDSPASAFDAASLKPSNSGSGSSSMHTRESNVEITNDTLRNIIVAACRIRDYQLIGPEWLRSERFDIVAKAPVGTPEKDLMPMLQTLLVERFQLQTHRESREFPVYGLVAAKSGFLPKTAGPGTGSNMSSHSDDKGGRLTAQRTSLDRLATWLSSRMDRPVIDMTGISGVYDFTLQYTL